MEDRFEEETKDADRGERGDDRGLPQAKVFVQKSWTHHPPRDFGKILSYSHPPTMIYEASTFN